MIGADISKLYLNDLLLSYLPLIGLAAANILARALRVAYIPALVMEIVYCSIAS
jgi:hypothetical protein